MSDDATTAAPAGYDKPLPQIDADSAPFWDGCRAGELRIPTCQGCGHHFMPPRPLCPRCHGREIGWTPVSPRGTVYTAVTVYHAPHPGFKADVPYNIALIELEHSVRLWSNVVGCAPDDVRIGMPVSAVFVPVTPEVTLPQFRPVKEEA